MCKTHPFLCLILGQKKTSCTRRRYGSFILHVQQNISGTLPTLMNICWPRPGLTLWWGESGGGGVNVWQENSDINCLEPENVWKLTESANSSASSLILVVLQQFDAERTLEQTGVSRNRQTEDRDAKEFVRWRAWICDLANHLRKSGLRWKLPNQTKRMWVSCVHFINTLRVTKKLLGSTKLCDILRRTVNQCRRKHTISASGGEKRQNYNDLCGPHRCAVGPVYWTVLDWLSVCLRCLRAHYKRVCASVVIFVRRSSSRCHRHCKNGSFEITELFETFCRERSCAIE